jgi:hypothetical protein
LPSFFDEQSLHYNNIRFTIAVRRGALLTQAAIDPKECILVLHTNPPFVLLCVWMIRFGCKLLVMKNFILPCVYAVKRRFNEKRSYCDIYTSCDIHIDPIGMRGSDAAGCCGHCHAFASH